MGRKVRTIAVSQPEKRQRLTKTTALANTTLFRSAPVSRPGKYLPRLRQPYHLLETLPPNTRTPFLCRMMDKNKRHVVWMDKKASGDLGYAFRMICSSRVATDGKEQGMAMNMLLSSHKPQQQQQSSGLGGLAAQFLGGNSHSNSNQSNSSNSGGAGGLVGKLAGNFLGGGNKPHGQQTSSSAGTSTAGNSSHSSGLGGLGSLLSGHSSSVSAQQ